MPTDRYYVETIQGPKYGTKGWAKFSNVIEGKQKAEEHLKTVVDFARENGVDADNVRLHEMTEDEAKQDLLDTHWEVFDRYLLSLPLGELESIVRDQPNQVGMNADVADLAGAPADGSSP